MAAPRSLPAAILRSSRSPYPWFFPGSAAAQTPLQFFDAETGVGEDTNFAREAHCLLRDLFSAQLCMFQQRARRSERKWPTRSYRANSVVRLDHVAITRKEERRLRIGHQQ